MILAISLNITTSMLTYVPRHNNVSPFAKSKQTGLTLT